MASWIYYLVDEGRYLFVCLCVIVCVFACVRACVFACVRARARAQTYLIYIGHRLKTDTFESTCVYRPIRAYLLLQAGVSTCVRISKYLTAHTPAQVHTSARACGPRPDRRATARAAETRDRDVETEVMSVGREMAGRGRRPGEK